MERTDTHAPVRTALKRQYHAGLAMLRDAIERFPAERWTEPVGANAFWQVAYHTLFYTHWYLHAAADDHRTFPGHQAGVQSQGGLTKPGDAASPLPVLPQPYDRDHLLAFTDYLIDTLDARMDELDVGAEDSGFSWYPIPKLEHQLVNLRHLQHHVGQLSERARLATGDGTRWWASGRAHPRPPAPSGSD